MRRRKQKRKVVRKEGSEKGKEREIKGGLGRQARTG